MVLVVVFRKVNNLDKRTPGDLARSARGEVIRVTRHPQGGQPMGSCEGKQELATARSVMMAPMRTDNTIADMAPILDYLVNVADTEMDMAQLFSCSAVSHLELVCRYQFLLWISWAGLDQDKL